MKIRMLVKISGGRGDGSVWPDPGGELVVGDEEGAQLCAGGLAVPVAEKPPVEERTRQSGKTAAKNDKAD